MAPPTSILPLHLQPQHQQQQQEQQHQERRKSPDHQRPSLHPNDLSNPYSTGSFSPGSFRRDSIMDASDHSHQSHSVAHMMNQSASSQQQMMNNDSSQNQSHSSFGSSSSSFLLHQRSYMDERRRQRVLYGLGRGDDSESNAEGDPLFITPAGIDPHNAQATATSMSRKFFLTPPERLQVDQSVNLMDVEMGQYETTPRRASWFIGELPSKVKPNSNNTTQANQSGSPLNSDGKGTATATTGLFSGLSGIFHSPNHNSGTTTTSKTSPLLVSDSERSQGSRRVSFLEAFMDEELGMDPKDTKASSRRRKRKSSSKRSSKQPKEARQAAASDSENGVAFPEGYDPNLWESRAAQASRKTDPLLPGSNDNNGVEDGDVDDNQTTKMANTGGNKKKNKKKKRRGRRRLGRRQEGRPRRLSLGRLAIVCLVLFLVLVAILAPLIATGDIAWHKWHKTPSPSNQQDDPVLIDGIFMPQQNLSYLDITALPESTQLLLADKQDETPQDAALRWLQQDSQITLVTKETKANLNKTLTPLDKISATQRFVLATLFYATKGNTWAMSSHLSSFWMNYNSTECEWFGGDHHVHGNYNVCNRYHQLHSLHLRGRNLTGSLPVTELALLSNLKHVDLGHNNLTGILSPTLLGNAWKNLEDLDMTHNSLTGQLPTELGKLTNSNGLSSIKLDYNALTGQIPSEIGKLVNRLKILELAHNELTGSIPTELGGLDDFKALEKLSLASNHLTGIIPSELGLLTQLSTLDLHHNVELTPQDLPQEICELQLQYQLERITVDCDIVKCPSQCDCTCMSKQQHPKLEGAVTVDSSNSLHDNDVVITKKAKAHLRGRG